MNNKIAIFPIDYNNVTLARYANLGKYEPIALVTPSLNVLEGIDISKLDGGINANIPLQTDYKQKISDCRVVYFTDSDLVPDNSIYDELIAYAKELDKEIIIDDHLLTRLEAASVTLKSQANYDEFSKLLSIEVPIISLLTIDEKCGQSQTEWSIRKYFLSRGYKILQLSSQGYSNLLGSFILPKFLFDITLDVEKKIIMFNKFIYDLCLKEKPDLIIISVPTPIMKFNDEILNGLGVLPFIIQNAIKSDIGLINLSFNEYTYEYLDYIMQFCKFRLNVIPKYFSISNTVVTKNMDENKLDYLYLNIDFVKSNLDSNIGKDYYTVFATYDEENMVKAFQKIEQELLTNPNQI